MTEEELWEIVEPAIWDIVRIGGDLSMPMFNKDIVEKVQRALPPGEYVDPDHILRMIEDYWQVDPDTFEEPDDLDP